VENNAVAEQGVEEGIPRVLKADYVDLDFRGRAEIRCETQQVETSPEHGDIRVGAGTRPSSRAGAEEEGQADILLSAQSPTQGFDDRVWPLHARESTSTDGANQKANVFLMSGTIQACLHLA